MRNAFKTHIVTACTSRSAGNERWLSRHCTCRTLRCGVSQPVMISCTATHKPLQLVPAFSSLSCIVPTSAMTHNSIRHVVPPMHQQPGAQHVNSLTQQRIDGTVRQKQFDVMPVMFTCIIGRPKRGGVCLPLRLSARIWVAGAEAPRRSCSWQDAAWRRAQDCAHLVARVPQLKETVLQVEHAQCWRHSFKADKPTAAQ